MFFRALPNRTLALRGTDVKGGKLAKERITVLLACNAAGEKFRLLIVGRAENPRCFKGLKKSQLPVFYTSNRKAWMTSEIFDDFLHNFNFYIQKRNKNAILFLENAPVHNIAKQHQYSNVKVKFLPANTTAICQPLDQGIIRAWKSRYQSLLLRRLIALMDSAEKISLLMKDISVKNSIDFAVSAWDDLLPSIIENCFRKSGLWKSTSDSEGIYIEAVENSAEDQQNKLSSFMFQLKFGDKADTYVNFDIDFEVFDAFQPDTRAEAGKQLQEQGSNDLADILSACEEEIEIDSEPTMSNKEATKALDSLKQ